MAYKLYTKLFKKVLPGITAEHTGFIRAFSGRIQVIDGISDTATAMRVKESNQDVVIQTYNTDPDVAFGAGTSNSNRFGERTEVKSVDIEIPYNAPIAIHEGIDGFTVNDDRQSVLSDRIEKILKKQASFINGYLSVSLSTNASETITGTLDEAGVIAAFDQAAKTFTNNNINKQLKFIAYVSPDVYNILVNSGLTTTSKRSTVNVDENGVARFKGFDVISTPDNQFQTGENIYFVVENVGIIGAGIEVLRVIDSEDFYGVAIQGAGKYATYVAEAHKAGILKATLGN